jgi:hypothetical protein
MCRAKDALLARWTGRVGFGYGDGLGVHPATVTACRRTAAWPAVGPRIAIARGADAGAPARAKAMGRVQQGEAMLRDWRGEAVTAAGPATVAGIDDFAEGFLAYETRAANILAAAEADPDAPLAGAYAAMLWMFLESPEAPSRARPWIERAERAAPRGTERERMVVAAVRAWVDGDIPRALALGTEAARRFPRELALAKATQYHFFNLGDAPGMLRIALAVGDANRDLAYAHGLAAFAWEQCHMLREAEAAARRAMAIRPAEPWAHHALAHVMLTEGRTREGRAFLESVKESWAGLNSFMLTHNWWHLALVMIDQGDTDAILGFWDRTIWGVAKDYSQDQIGAVSLLARLELAGVDVGDRWEDVGAALAVRVGDTVQPFLSLQYLYGLGRAGRPEADAMLASIRDHAGTAPPFVRRAWSEVALPAAEGLLAHARGDHRLAAARLGPVLPRMADIGGSHAQRDLFDQIHLDALIRSGDLVPAQRILAQRRAASPEAVPNPAKLALIYERLDLPAEAARMAAEARALALRH